MAPRPGGGLTWARASLDTRHGGVAVEWHLTDDGLEVDVTVPDGVTAEIDLPDGQRQRVTGGRHHLTSADAVSSGVA